MNHTKCSHEGLNFACNNLPDACSVEITNNLWKTKNRQHHSFISETKSSNILSMPKDTGSTFGMPPQTDIINSKCRYTILWLPLIVPDTTALDNPCQRIFNFWKTLLQSLSMSLLFSFIFPSNSFLSWIHKSGLGLAGVSTRPKPSYFFPFPFFSQFTVLNRFIGMKILFRKVTH